MSITYRFAAPPPGSPEGKANAPVMSASGQPSEGRPGVSGLGEAPAVWRKAVQPVPLPTEREPETPPAIDTERTSEPLLLDRARRVAADLDVPEAPSSEPQDDGPATPTEVMAQAGAAPDSAAPVNLPVKWAGKRAHLILVARARGGMGATSVAVNLALDLAKPRGLFRSALNRRVALVDLDVQFGTAGSMLDVEDAGGMLALARMLAEPDRQAVRTAMVRHQSGLDVLPAPKRAIPLDALDSTRVASILEPLLADYDVVVVDLPHALVRWLEPLLQQADRMLIVTDLAVPSVVTARRVIDLMREDNADLNVEIVVTREKKPLFPGKLQHDATLALGLPLTHWIPAEPELSRRACDRGEALLDLAPRCPWSRALHKLAKHIETAMEAANKNRKE